MQTETDYITSSTNSINSDMHFHLNLNLNQRHYFYAKFLKVEDDQEQLDIPTCLHDQVSDCEEDFNVKVDIY